MVYAALATCVGDGNIAYVGQRRIAGLSGISVTTVTAGIAQLIERGHIEIDKRQFGKRAAYRLASDQFGWKQAAGVRALVMDQQSKHVRAASLGYEELKSQPRKKTA